MGGEEVRDLEGGDGVGHFGLVGWLVGWLGGWFGWLEEGREGWDWRRLI